MSASPHQQRWTISKGFKDRADDDPFDYPFVSVEGPDTEPVEVVSAVVAERLVSQMAEVRRLLHHDQRRQADAVLKRAIAEFRSPSSPEADRG